MRMYARNIARKHTKDAGCREISRQMRCSEWQRVAKVYAEDDYI